ncbi:VanZ family protein [Desulfofundulus thermobenzoicus]|uniref:VanZ family protein n=1 Tax=Desulfofundulus thermobenzoicus TaxID=29376 RepID=UPI00128F9F0E
MEITGRVLQVSFKVQKHWWRWLLVGVCLLAIAYFSGQSFAEQDLRPEIRRHPRMVEKVRELPPVSFSYSGQPVDNRRAPADFIQFWLRKGAHVVIYGALGLSLAAALDGAGSGGRRRWMLAGVIVILVGALDEWHQTFVPGRTGRAVDVLVDLAGFVVLVFFFSLFVRFREKSFASQEIRTVDRGSAFVSLFGERLAFLRQQKGLSQAELARLLGVGQSTIAMYEKNKRLPDYQFLIRLANFFGVSTDYLLGRVDQPHFSGDEKVMDVKLHAVAIDPLFAGLLRRVSDLTEEKKQTLAEYWELALEYVKSKKKSKN